MLNWGSPPIRTPPALSNVTAVRRVRTDGRGRSSLTEADTEFTEPMLKPTPVVIRHPVNAP
jgi:hypothetical protein